MISLIGAIRIRPKNPTHSPGTPARLWVLSDTMDQPVYGIDVRLPSPQNVKEYLALDQSAYFVWETATLICTDFPVDSKSIDHAWLRYRLCEKSLARFGAPSFRKEDIPVTANDEKIDSAMAVAFETFSQYAMQVPPDDSVVLFFLFHKRNPYIIRRARSSENSPYKFTRITINETESVAHELHQAVYDEAKIPVAPETLTIGVVAISPNLQTVPESTSTGSS